MRRHALFSSDRKHRYALYRTWDVSLPALIVVGLNPSTADESVDDPTIRKCIGYARREGCGQLVMLNLYSYRETDSRKLKEFDAFTLTNDSANQSHVKQEIERISTRYGKVKIVCAWGSCDPHGYGALFRVMLGAYELHCFGHNKDGSPKHPLYLKNDTPIERWEPLKFTALPGVFK